MTNLTSMSNQGTCWGFFSCMEPEGLFGGVSRAEKLALRRAQVAEHRFRVSRGYERDTMWHRIQAYLDQSSRKNQA